MDTFQFLMSGFATILQPQHMVFIIIGCFLGTLIGVLPGIGPAGGTAMLIPVTFILDPIDSIAMLCAIYYGAMYGGTITSVLVNVPGEAASAITCIEGNQMAKKGRAGAALSIAAIGSFIGTTVATLGLVLLAVPLTSLALMFGPPEFFALMVLGLSLVTGLAGKSLVRALMSAVLGLMVAMVGIDPVMGVPRFTFGLNDLLGGLNIIPVAMGVFGIGEILLSTEAGVKSVLDTKITSLWITLQDWKDSVWSIVRGTGIGFFLGLIPGIGAIIPTFISYVAEKKFSKNPETFGTGRIEGVAGPETANNAYANAAMIPLFTLGIPGSATIAILMGAFMMNGLIPGPFLFIEHAQFVWAVIASFYIGNVILVIMNLPMIPLWVSVLKIPNSILYAFILCFCVIGAYSLSNSIFDVGALLMWGIIGYIFKKLDIPATPLILTLILGPLMESGLRRSLEMSQGDITILFTRPISAALLAAAAIPIIFTTLRIATKVKGETQL